MKRLYSVIFALLLISCPVMADEEVTVIKDSVTNVEANDVVQSMQISSLEDLIARATLSYEQGNFKQAIDDYEALASAYGTSSELFYNLGNAYFKNKDFARAILNYERCLLYDPSNDDAKANLELSKMNCVDKIETVQPVIFKTWSNSIGNLMSCDAWSMLSIVLFLVFIVSLFVYFFVRKVTYRKIGFYLGILAIILCFISMGYAKKQQKKIEIRNNAIIMSPSVTVKSSPADSGTQLFNIHEGLKVKVRSTLSGWSEVEISDGNVGWVPSNSIEII